MFSDIAVAGEMAIRGPVSPPELVGVKYWMLPLPPALTSAFQIVSLVATPPPGIE